MTTRTSDLDTLQRWMLRAITDSTAGGHSDDLGVVILPSAQQSAAERLAVYQHAYFARLLGVLRELFPCTCFAKPATIFFEEQ